MQGDERKPAGPEFRIAEVFRALQLAGLSATMRSRGLQGRFRYSGGDGNARMLSGVHGVVLPCPAPDAKMPLTRAVRASKACEANRGGRCAWMDTGRSR